MNWFLYDRDLCHEKYKWLNYNFVSNTGASIGNLRKSLWSWDAQIRKKEKETVMKDMLLKLDLK